jgi:hypothetical protein
MLATEHAARLQARLATIAQAADEAAVDLDALHLADPDDAARWLPALKEAVSRIQLECAEARFAVRELRDALPGPETLQPRLMD